MGWGEERGEGRDNKEMQEKIVQLQREKDQVQ